MDEQALRGLIAEVKVGEVSRRAFVQKMVALGLTGADGQPDAEPLRAWRRRRPKFDYKPTKRGGGGALKLLWWQGATLLNPHFAVGTKDQEGSRIFYEPLAGWDPDGNLVPVLAAEIPSRRERRARRRRHVGDLEAQARRAMARRQAVHRRRCRVQLGIRLRSGDRRDDDRQLQGRQGREGRRLHRDGALRQADAVLGRCLCRRARHDHPEASVRATTRAPIRATRRPT